MTATLAAPTMYDRYLKLSKEIRLLGGVQSLLGWDLETYMPKKALAIRAEEQALLATLAHERLVSSELGDVISALEADKGLSAEQRACVRESRRAHDRARKLPKEHVAELSRVTAHAHETWVEGRKKSDFSLFAPHLATIVKLKQREADLIGYATERYDALLDAYEPSMTAAEVAPVLGGLRKSIVPLVQAIREKPQPRAVKGAFPRAAQETFIRSVLTAMGFDFDAGRIDVSTHPFCSSSQPHDVRLTTRFDEQDIRPALFGSIHEAGHGLYDQGVLAEHFGTPLGEAVSLGIHESQSRMWENMIARSGPFWEHFYPQLKALFPAALADVDLETWRRSINVVRPSMIRVEADEVTYNLHILLRFEVERALMRDEVAVADLPALWNAKMREYVGVEPKNDAEGVLQDIHWSFGGIGYFPTYTLGNLYAAQILETIVKERPTLWAEVARGELLPLKGWLNERIHRHGSMYPPAELIRRVTGAPLSAEPFVRYVTKKYGAMYGL